MDPVWQPAFEDEQLGTSIFIGSETVLLRKSTDGTFKPICALSITPGTELLCMNTRDMCVTIGTLESIATECSDSCDVRSWVEVSTMNIDLSTGSGLAPHLIGASTYQECSFPDRLIIPSRYRLPACTNARKDARWRSAGRILSNDFSHICTFKYNASKLLNESCIAVREKLATTRRVLPPPNVCKLQLAAGCKDTAVLVGIRDAKGKYALSTFVGVSAPAAIRFAEKGSHMLESDFDENSQSASLSCNSEKEPEGILLETVVKERRSPPCTPALPSDYYMEELSLSVLEDLISSWNFETDGCCVWHSFCRRLHMYVDKLRSWHQCYENWMPHTSWQCKSCTAMHAEKVAGNCWLCDAECFNVECCVKGEEDM